MFLAQILAANTTGIICFGQLLNNICHQWIVLTVMFYSAKIYMGNPDAYKGLQRHGRIRDLVDGYIKKDKNKQK